MTYQLADATKYAIVVSSTDYENAWVTYRRGAAYPGGALYYYDGSWIYGTYDANFKIHLDDDEGSPVTYENYQGQTGYTSYQHKSAMTFTTTSAHKMDAISLRWTRWSKDLPSDELTIEIQATTDGKPNGTVLMTATIPFNDMPTSAPTWHYIELEAVAVYDYPLSPVLFPAQHKGTPLRKKCIHFEESMSDICLNMNNNTKVIREYLQLTYGDTTYPESSNLRDVLPSQQLVKLMNKDLTEEDFKAIINNFMTNISSMFTLINENNRLVKTWLDDYEPDEEGHDFTDVKMKPIILDKDLSKTINSLFEGITDNVTILNMNLEVLKERF